MAKIDWKEIDKELLGGKSPAELAALYNIKVDTISRHIRRQQLAVPGQAFHKNIEQKLAVAVDKAVAKIAPTLITNWAEKGEEHRNLAFEKAHESIKKFKPKEPKSFRELEAADKVARRAAGLETADTIQQTLVNVNERIEDFDEVVEAEVVETS